jgi:hypothetical protein
MLPVGWLSFRLHPYLFLQWSKAVGMWSKAAAVGNAAAQRRVVHGRRRCAAGAPQAHRPHIHGLPGAKRMAKVVDKQNAADKAYQPMSGRLKASVAFQAASDLVFKGLAQPSGYTEPLLHAWRLKVKGAAQSA